MSSTLCCIPRATTGIGASAYSVRQGSGCRRGAQSTGLNTKPPFGGLCLGGLTPQECASGLYREVLAPHSDAARAAIPGLRCVFRRWRLRAPTARKLNRRSWALTLESPGQVSLRKPGRVQPRGSPLQGDHTQPGTATPHCTGGNISRGNGLSKPDDG